MLPLSRRTVVTAVLFSVLYFVITLTVTVIVVRKLSEDPAATLFNSPALIILIFWTIVLFFAAIAGTIYWLFIKRIQEIERHLHDAIQLDSHDLTDLPLGKDDFTATRKLINKLLRVNSITHRALQESESLYKALFNASSDAYMIISGKFKVTFTNKQCNDLLDMNADEIEGINFVDILVPEQYDALVREALTETLRAPKVSLQIQLKRKATDLLKVDIACASISIKEKPYILLRIRDTSHETKVALIEKEYSKQIEAANRYSAFGKTTLALVPDLPPYLEEIKKRQEDITSSFRAMKPFLDTFYEKTPLLRISNMPYEMFLQSFEESLFSLKEAGENIAALLEDVKRVSAGVTDKEVSYLLFQDILEAALKLCAPFIRKKRISVFTSFKSSIPMRGNRISLLQAVINILLNSIDAVEPNTGTISITTSADEDGKPACVFKDNGPGISVTEEKIVLKPFYTTKDFSAGLGLAVSYAIFERIGATITLNALPEKGTTVTILFGNK